MFQKVCKVSFRVNVVSISQTKIGGLYLYSKKAKEQIL